MERKKLLSEYRRICADEKRSIARIRERKLALVKVFLDSKPPFLAVRECVIRNPRGEVRPMLSLPQCAGALRLYYAEGAFYIGEANTARGVLVREATPLEIGRIANEDLFRFLAGEERRKE